MTLEELFAHPPYDLTAAEKETALAGILAERTRFHYDNCPEYRRILDKLDYPLPRLSSLAVSQFPFIPVRLFKQFELLSVAKEKIVKTLTSSGTSGQAVSRIFLDADNVRNQTKALNAIISSFIGKGRLPLLLLDTEMIKQDRSMYSARGAGIIGFSIFGRDSTFALDAEMKIALDRVTVFFEKHSEEPILMFGYTYMIWQFVVRALEEAGKTFNVKNAILFHIGGWKKLKDQQVDALEFKRRVQGVLGDVKVYNYYGMAEQLGSVFVECEHGHMHCPNYSDVIIRKSYDFSEAKIGEKGLIELLSVLPTSYPGHVLLTEDEGAILGVDDCPCGRKGKYFKIFGRIKSAEIRGCSDTFERR
jgi:phenylacetate-coenzyme A ligase PaaK-like adenylate-forming protein